MPFPILWGDIFRGGIVIDTKDPKQIERAWMRSEILARMACQPLDSSGRPQAVKADSWRSFLQSLGIRISEGKARQWRMAFYSLRFKYGRIAFSLTEVDEGRLVGSHRLINS